MYIYVYIYIYIFIYICICMYVCVHIYIYTYIHTYTYIHISTSTSTYIHAYIHAYIHNIYRFPSVYVTYKIHIYIQHIHTHTYTHTLQYLEYTRHYMYTYTSGNRGIRHDKRHAAHAPPHRHGSRPPLPLLLAACRELCAAGKGGVVTLWGASGPTPARRQWCKRKRR
jgi:hypothetical protein